MLDEFILRAGLAERKRAAAESSAGHSRAIDAPHLTGRIDEAVEFIARNAEVIAKRCV
jgi:hypothetical protein